MSLWLLYLVDKMVIQQDNETIEICIFGDFYIFKVDNLALECSISNVLAMGLPQCYAESLIWYNIIS